MLSGSNRSSLYNSNWALLFLSSISAFTFYASLIFLQAIMSLFPYFCAKFCTMPSPIPLLHPVTIIFFNALIRKVIRKKILIISYMCI